MRRALLIAPPTLELDVSLALERMHELLTHLSFDTITPLTDADATRTALLPILDSWLATATPTDACLLYYFGHGGQLRFTDGPAPNHRFGFITTTPESRDETHGCILDIELSAALARLDRRCANVTAIFDCCHSGELARSGRSRAIVRDRPTPEWALAVLRNPATRDLAVDSHPRIARLTGTSPMREAYTFADERGGRPLGHLTRALIDTIHAADDRWPALTWEVMIHGIRERVIAALGMESQWVNFAGPRTRRLFSVEQTDPRRVIGLVPDPEVPTRGWLRAGACSGVRIGDRFRIHAPNLAEVAVAEVVEVELNRCMISPSTTDLPIGCCAEHALAEAPETRAKRLLDSVAALPSDDDVPLQWSWGRVGPDNQLLELPLAPASLEPDDRLWIRIEHLGMPPLSWFASAVLIDTLGHAHLLNARAPEGLELIPGEHQLLGVRFGIARQGLPIPHAEQPGDATLLLLACRRPIELGHLVDSHPSDLGEAFALQGIEADADMPARGGSTAPVLATGWSARRIDLSIKAPRAAEAERENSR